MPLVRIDLMKNSDASFGQRVGKVVYESMRSSIGIPDHDNFQIITEHDAQHLIFDTSYLGIERTPGFVTIQIALNEGRTLEQKKVLYRTIAQGLERLGLRQDDVFINLIEVKKENWSFGGGIAQYAV
jgi:phenylpyruvate tautomerase PptA (4-oxalocrotonate tautomerase family)